LRSTCYKLGLIQHTTSLNIGYILLTPIKLKASKLNYLYNKEERKIVTRVNIQKHFNQRKLAQIKKMILSKTFKFYALEKIR